MDAAGAWPVTIDDAVDRAIHGLTRGQRNVDWIHDNCKMAPPSPGNPDGIPLRLLPHQLEAVLAIYDNPLMPTRTAILSWARKNGKTFLVAALVLLHLCGPEALPNTQLVSAARARDQAAIVYDFARQVVQASPALQPYVGLRDSRKELYCLAIGTHYKALSADAKTKHGMNPCLAIHDELGQVEGPADPLYSTLETAMSAQANPLSIIISTQAPRDTDLLSMLIDDALEGHDPSTVVRVTCAPDNREAEAKGEPGIDPFSEEALRLANPAYGITQKPAELHRLAQQARRMPSFEPQYRNLILNQRYEAKAPFLVRALWDACANREIKPPPKSVQCYLGIDLSSIRDLTAAVLLWEADGKDYVWPICFLPKKDIGERSVRDRVPYDVWMKAGHIVPLDGTVIDYAEIVPHIVRLLDLHEIVAAGFDRWNWTHFLSALRRHLEKIRHPLREKYLEKFIPIGMGHASMTPALRDVETAVESQKLQHPNNPILNMCASNAIVRGTDQARIIKKPSERARIDVLMAAVISFAARQLRPAPPKPSLRIAGA